MRAVLYGAASHSGTIESSNTETVPVEAGLLDGTGACGCWLQFFRCDSTCLGFVKEKGASAICWAFVNLSAEAGAIVARDAEPLD